MTSGTGKAEHTGLVFGEQGDKVPVRRASLLILRGVGDGEKRAGGQIGRGSAPAGTRRV